MGLHALTTSTAAVTLAEAKAHLRIDGTADDAILTTFALAATEWVQNETRQQLVDRAFLLTVDALPAGGDIKLPRIPLSSVTSVQYRDAAGTLQTFDDSTYTVDAVTRPGRVVLRPSAGWPGTFNPIEVRFIAGYGTAADVPQILKQCVLLMLGSMFENREGAIDRRIDVVPLAVESIINQHVYLEAV